MIYTSYFAKLKSLPENIIPISICGKAPDWYKGLQYKKLAPKYDFFMEWKKNQRLGIGCRFTVMTEMRSPGGHRKKQWCCCSDWKCAQGKYRIPRGKQTLMTWTSLVAQW